MATEEVASRGSTPTFIAAALHPRIQKALNWYGLLTIAINTAKTARNRWRARTEHYVTVSGSDPLYPELEAWLIEQIPARRRKATKVRYVRPPSNGDEVLAESVDGRQESLPTHGHIAVVYDGHLEQPVQIGGQRVVVQVEQQDVNDRRDRHKLPSMKFTTHSVQARDAVIDMLADLAHRRASVARQPAFYITNRWGGFNRLRDHHPRRLDSIVLPDDIMKPLLDDLYVFLMSEARYAQLGIPWHRGYLFTGVPGTGKSSLAAALADHFALDTYFLVPAAIDGDDTLVGMLAEVSPRSMLVIEDVDGIHASRDRDDDSRGGITTQALLQALDGMVTPHGMITVMTTNRADILDPALVRPGRADLTIEIPKLDRHAIRDLLFQFTGQHYEIPNTSGVPGSSVVEVIKPYVHDPEAVDRAIRGWISEGLR